MRLTHQRDPKWGLLGHRDVSRSQGVLPPGSLAAHLGRTGALLQAWVEPDSCPVDHATSAARQPVELLADRTLAVNGAGEDLDSRLACARVANLLPHFGPQVGAWPARLG